VREQEPVLVPALEPVQEQPVPRYSSGYHCSQWW
jgi:hypothetical protein